MYYLVVNRPFESLAGIVLMLAGLILYAIAQNYPAAPAVPKATLTK
jgi:hypothetical protein